MTAQPAPIDLPIPFGWFSVGPSADFPVGEVVGRRYVERELVVWRGADGEPRVMDAFCPHLGAHLGVGGTVEGDRIVCPFHGWQFDGAGSCVEIPYSERVNRRARVRTFPVVERNGHVFFWWHPDSGVEPQWEIPHLPGVEDGTFSETDEWIVDTHWQEVAENAFDMAHFVFVHGLDEMGSLGDYRFDGPRRSGRSTLQFKTSKGTFDGSIELETYGPGLGYTHFHVIGHAYLVSTPTPIERRRLHNRFSWVYADDDVSQKVGPMFSAEVKRQFEQDMPIWINKAYVEPPSLAPFEKAIADFRRWAAQFYLEP